MQFLDSGIIKQLLTRLCPGGHSEHARLEAVYEHIAITLMYEFMLSKETFVSNESKHEKIRKPLVKLAIRSPSSPNQLDIT